MCVQVRVGVISERAKEEEWEKVQKNEKGKQEHKQS